MLMSFCQNEARRASKLRPMTCMLQRSRLMQCTGTLTVLSSLSLSAELSACVAVGLRSTAPSSRLSLADGKPRSSWYRFCSLRKYLQAWECVYLHIYEGRRYFSSTVQNYDS